MSDAVAKRETVKSLLERPEYRVRFQEVLRDRAPQFMASLCALSAQSGLAQCDPKGVIAAAFTAATLDLPIEKNLGFAHVIPYKGHAQFQMGYKGYIQLALRTGQYKRMAAYGVNVEAFRGVDEFREPIIDHTQLDETKPPVGYCAIFELANGFRKAAYWSKEQVVAHAKRYSQAYRAGKQDSPWFTQFDAMALKTVLANTLRMWGILSVQMQRALTYDQSAQTDIEGDPIYIDNEATVVRAEPEAVDAILATAEPEELEIVNAPEHDRLWALVNAAKTADELTEIAAREQDNILNLGHDDANELFKRIAQRKSMMKKRDEAQGLKVVK